MTQSVVTVDFVNRDLLPIEVGRLRAEEALLHALRDLYMAYTDEGQHEAFFNESLVSPSHLIPPFVGYALAYVDAWIRNLIQEEPDYGALKPKIPLVLDKVLSRVAPAAVDMSPTEESCLMDFHERYGNFLSDPLAYAEACIHPLPGRMESSGDWERIVELSFKRYVGVGEEDERWDSLYQQLRMALRSPATLTYFKGLVSGALLDREVCYEIMCLEAELQDRGQTIRPETASKTAEAPTSENEALLASREKKLRTLVHEYKEDKKIASMKDFAESVGCHVRTLEYYLTGFDGGNLSIRRLAGPLTSKLEGKLQLRPGILKEICMQRSSP
jgi:hypothetical protein